MAVSILPRMWAGWDHWILTEVYLSLLQSIQTTSGTHPVSSPMSITVLSQHIKCPDSDTDLLLGLKSGMYGAVSPHTYVFMVWCLVTHRDSITLRLSLHNVQFQAINEHSFMLFSRVNVQPKITLYFGRGCFTHLECIRKQNLHCLQVDIIASVSSGLNCQQTQH